MNRNYNGVSESRDTRLLKEKKNYFAFLRLVSVMAFLLSFSVNAQVASTYAFSQANGAFVAPSTGLVGATGAPSTTPASIFGTSWDDGVSTMTLPFTFTYNGISYTQVTISGNGFIVFGSALTPNASGSAYVSSTDASGVYLNGTSTANGFAGFNLDQIEKTFATFVGTRTNTSNVITAVASFANLKVGMRLSGTGISSGAIITALDSGAATITMSAPATANSSSAITPRSAIYAAVLGTSPNRQYVITTIAGRRFGGANAADSFDFQFVLSESNNSLSVVYGPMAVGTTATAAQAGIRTTTADYNSRTTTTDWSTTTASTVNTDKLTVSTTVLPTSGLTYTWTYVPPSCLIPSGVTATPTTNSAAITWNCVGCTGTFDLDYGTPGHTAGTGTIVNGVSSGYVITPLTSSTAYTVYVRQDCTNTANGVGSWSVAVNFSTLFDCAAAPVLTSSTPVTSGNLATTGSAMNVTSCGFQTLGKEAIYQYTAPVSGVYTLDITNVNGGTGFIDYFFKTNATSCTDSTGWTCIDDNNTVGIDTFTLTGGVTYYILLDAEPASGTANHTFQIVPPPVCNGANGGTTSADVTSCGATTPTITASGYSFGTVSTYQWEFSNDNFVTNVNDFVGQTNPAALTTGLVSTTTYYRLRVTCDTGVLTAYSNTVTVTINALPAATVAVGGGTFCTTTTITASNGNDGTMYFQGTTSNGTSTAIASSSETITVSGTYYFRAQNPTTLCWGPQGSVTVIIQQPANITGTDASVCQGGSGSISAVDANNCSGFNLPGASFSGTFTLADPQANRPTTSIINTTTCSFQAVPVLRGYQAQPFQVSVTGSYVLGMSTVDDGMGYITTGAFTPGSCATGTWIIGDDDSNGGADARLTVVLTAGVDYTLYSTTWSSATNGNSTAAYTWTVASAPVGGQIMFPFSGNIEWYTAASGGSPIATGSSLNPVGLAGSGLADTNTPGTTTYYAACSASNACRVPVNFVINPATTNGSLTASAFGSYTWAAPSGNGQTYTASGVYTYTTTDGNGCTNIATLTLTISPIVNSFTIGTSCGAMVSNLAVTVVAAGVPGATAYTFRVTNVATSASFVVTRPVNSLALGNYTTVTLATEYQIEVSTNGGTTYGPPCTLFTPRPTSTIGAQCGTTLTSMTQFVYATLATSVTGYRFRVTNSSTNAVEVYTPLSNVNRFSFSQLPAAFVAYGTTYSVEVALRNTDGSYLPYGTACTITTPAFPTSEIVLSQCDTVATSNTQTFNAVVVSGATAYRFQLTNSTLAYNFSIDRPLGNYSLSMFPGLVAGTTYTVRVAVRIGGVWGPLTGKPCNVTTPGIAPGGERTVVANNDFVAIAYPNPFAENFMFDVMTTAESTIQIRVYDMLGKQVENRNVEATEINNIQFGDAYPSGVYNVVISQEEQTRNVRVIKR